MYIKICARCGSRKAGSQFYQNPRTRDRLQSYCKDCTKAVAAEYLKTEKGKAALRRALEKKKDEGYYRFGKGAIAILRQGAKKRDIEFELTAEELEKWWLQTADICHYCGSSLEQYLKLRDFVIADRGSDFRIYRFKRFFRSPRHSAIQYMTIDRVDNSKGYSVRNIVKACWFCNSLKSDFFYESEFKMIGQSIISDLIAAIRKQMRVS